MTAIFVHHKDGRIDRDQRAALAVSLTDAVLGVECGQILASARIGFQVHFLPLPADHMAIGGKLVSETDVDLMVIDVAVMDGHWPPADRKKVIDGLFAALCRDLGVAVASPTWWINFGLIDEGSWGSRGKVLSILDLLGTGAFTDERGRDICNAIAAAKSAS